MKRCPECRRDYFDDTLSFCLEDGRQLVSGVPAGSLSGDEPSTAVLLNANSTDEALTRIFESDASAVASKPSTDRKRIDRKFLVASAAGFLVLAALGIGSYSYFSDRYDTQINSIAVMPFVNESGDADIEYLSDGMTETLISSLSQLPNLNVKARSSVFRYKGKDTNARTIAQELNVQALLTGKVVQRAADLSLYVELVDAESDKVIWSETYDRPMMNLVAMQKEIARDVSNNLRTKLSAADERKLSKNYTANTEAYKLYLQGRFHWNKRYAQGLEKSIEYFNQAVAADPSYALAYAGLADAYAVLPFYTKTESADAFPKAKASAKKAIELDESLAEAHATLAHVKMWYDWDWSGAEKDFKRAIELDPNYPTAHHWYALHLSLLERHGEALKEIRSAHDLDPLSLGINLDLGVVYFNARQFDQSIKQLNKTLELDPDFLPAYLYLMDAYEQKDMYEEAAAAVEKVIVLNGGNAGSASGLRRGYNVSGGRGYYQEKIKLLLARWEREGAGAYQIAGVRALLGENDQAIEWLEKSYEKRELSLANLRVSPEFDTLRSDPRFKYLMRRVGFSE